SRRRRRGSSPCVWRCSPKFAPRPVPVRWRMRMSLATAGLGTAPEESVAAEVGSALESVFDAVSATRAETAALLARVGAEGRRPATVDLAALRPGLHL